MEAERVNVDELLHDLRVAGEAADFEVCEYGRVRSWPLLALRRRAGPGAPRVYLSAGMHGDEPAGPRALLRLLRADALPRAADLLVCPVLNPGGLALGTRENLDGVDLNRDYAAFVSVEGLRHRELLEREGFRPELSLLLHEDWEAKGFYLYELNLSDCPSRAPAMLAALAPILPVETADRIDGHRASGGIIRPDRLPEIPEGLPEALYLRKMFGGLNYTLESPSGFPLEKRVEALMAAVRAGLATAQDGSQS